MARRRRGGSFASDASGLQQAIQGFGESFVEGNIFERRRRAQSDRELEREQITSQIRQRGLSEALHLLSMGNKQGAANILTGLGISVPTRDVTTRELAHEPVPGEDIEAQAFIPRVERTQREIALETPADRFTREQAVLQGREQLGRRETFEFGQRGAEAAEERVRERDHPPRTSDELGVSLFRKAAKGEPLTPSEQEFVRDFVRAQRKDPGFAEEFRNRIIEKISIGGVEALSPHERDFYMSNMRQRDPGAAARAEGREVERLGLERQRVQESRAARGETQEFREESRATNERNRVFNELDRARQTVEKKFERRRETVSLGTNRQQALAQLDTQEDAELTQLTERFKKLHPKYAPDIDAAYGGSTRPPQRPSILELFNQGPTRQGTPKG